MASFTADDKALITRLWVSGLSAIQIAADRRVSGQRSRNSIIGLVHRLGLSGAGGQHRARSQPPREKPAPKPTPKPAVVKTEPAAAAARPARPPRPEDHAGAGVDLLALSRNDCRWPVGRAIRADQQFCGEPRDNGLTPYCDLHTRRSVKAAGAPYPHPNTAREDAAGLPGGPSSSPRGER